MRSIVLFALVGLAIANDDHSSHPSHGHHVFSGIRSVWSSFKAHPSASEHPHPTGPGFAGHAHNEHTATPSHHYHARAGGTNSTATSSAPVAIVSNIDVNAPCAPQPGGFGPVLPDAYNDDAHFPTYGTFVLNGASATAPNGYAKVFQNLNGSIAGSSTTKYLGYYELKEYSPSQCTKYCDDTTGCVGVNLYYERDPSLNPAAACPNPPPKTAIKCGLWGSPVMAKDATNMGQWRMKFHVVIAGSDGFMKLPAQACQVIQSAWDAKNGKYTW